MAEKTASTNLKNVVQSRLLTTSQFKHIFIPSRTVPMASRRLALNLSQGLRNRASLNAVAPLRRGFATPVVKNGVKTESTTLSNGLTVCIVLHLTHSLLIAVRSPRNTRLGRRRRRSVYGSMLDLEQRRIRQMAQLTSSNILPSRYASIGSNGYGVELILAAGHEQADTTSIGTRN